jgi:hypothetical protein
MTFDDMRGPVPVEQMLDDLLERQGRLRLLLAVLLRPARPPGAAALPLDDRMRADIGLPPVATRQVVAGRAFILFL